MMNKFLAISLIVMIAFADASPLLKSWHAKQQRRMKSGATQKGSLQSSHQDAKTTTISLSSTGGRHGRKLSLSDPIQVVVNNLVAGDGQSNIICKALDKALKAGYAANPTLFYHTDLQDFVQSWRDVYNQDFTDSLCAGKLHAIELAGQTNSQPQVCVGFNLLEDGLDADGAVKKGNCPTYTTKFCADFKTDTSAATGTGTALAEAQEAIRTAQVSESNTTYADNYALRLVDNGDSVESVSRQFHTTDLPTISAISVGGCPGLALTIDYNAAGNSSSDPGNTYVPAAGLPGSMEQVETGITRSIYEEDNTAYTDIGTERLTSNSNFGSPKKYLVDANGDCPPQQGGDDFDYENQLNAPQTGSDGAVTQTSKGYCFKLLNGPNGVSGIKGVAIDGSGGWGEATTSSAKAQEAIADVDSCPGTAAVVNYCSIADFAALITGQTVNGQTGDCVRRVYTDLCTEKIDSSYNITSGSEVVTKNAHDHQYTSSDVANGKASYTKPLRISLPAGDYCDGHDSTSIGTCTLQRKLQNEFVFEMSCEELAAQMTANGSPTDVVGVRKLSIHWDIGAPHTEQTLAEKDPNVRADFHCAEGDNTGLCGINIPASHPCHGIVKKACANPYYNSTGTAISPIYTTYADPEDAAAQLSCDATDGSLLTAWETSIGKTGSYRSGLSINSELYDITCHDLRKEIEEDAKPKIQDLCDHIQADLDKARIDYATSYLLHDIQAVKKVQKTNYKSHITNYRSALDATCDASFGSSDVTSLNVAGIEQLREVSGQGDTLKQSLEKAATTPEDVAINIQRQKLDQRLIDLGESLNLLKEAYDSAAVPGVEVNAHIVKFNNLAKTIYKTLAIAFTEDIDTDNTVPEPFNTRIGKESACPHLGEQLLQFTDVYELGVLTSTPDLRRFSAASISGAGSADGLSIVLNDGTAKTITNLVSILEYLVFTSSYESESQSIEDRVDHLKEGLEVLIAETVEFCIWESEDRFDRCETCAARKQLFNDEDIYQRVYTRLNTLSTYKSQRSTLIAASCEAEILDDVGANIGGAGNALRVAECSIPSQSVLGSLAGIDGTASYIKGYPGTGYDNAATEDEVETDQAHHRYSNGNNVVDSLNYDKTAFQNDLAECESAIEVLDSRGCPSTTLQGLNNELALSSTQVQNLNTAAAGVNATTGEPLIGSSLSVFESRRIHCIDALDVVIVDTSDAYDCDDDAGSVTGCVDGSITHFVKQCLKTDGSDYVAHATPHGNAYDITSELNGPGIYQAIKEYTDAEDAYDTAVSARSTRESQLNIDPSELKNLNDDVHAAETYRDVILAHIGDLTNELKAFRNRHATVMTKCQDLVEAKVRAKVEHALELKKYDFEVDDLNEKKAAVNAKTYDGAKDALDEYCAEVAAVKDAVTIASLADVNKVVRAGTRCSYGSNGQPNSYAADSNCCKALVTGDTLDGLADRAARNADCIAADLAIEASKSCVLDASGNYDGYATKALCLDAISSGAGLGGQCVKTLPDGSVCTLNDECASGVCRDTVYNVGVAVADSDPVTYTYDDSVVKECAVEAYVLSGGNCTANSDCRPFSSIRTANPPSGATQHGNSGRWTQVCNSVGVCSDYNLGNEDDECATAASGDGHVGSTCATGLVCDSWFGADGVDDGSTYNDDSDRRSNGYETTSAHVGTNGKDVCIVDPSCTDGLHNNGEAGIDCGGNCLHTSVCVGEAAPGGSAQGSLASNGAACTFHSDCANGAACEQQYHYVLSSDGVTSCNAGETYYQDTCAHTAIAGDKRCGAPICAHTSAPSPNSLYGETVACAGSSSGTDPSASTQTLHQFTVNGITFTYYVQTATTGTTQGNGGRRLLSRPSINTHGFNFIHPVLEHASQQPRRLRSVRHRHAVKLAKRYQRLSHGEGSIDHVAIANSVDHWAEINDFANSATNSSSDLSVCRVPRGTESGSDQTELAARIPCVTQSDCCYKPAYGQSMCSLTCQGVQWDVERDSDGVAILDYLGATTPRLVSKGLCSAVSPGNSAYSVTNLPEVDALGVCDQGTTGTGFANDGEYGAAISEKYGYTVSSNLHLNRQHHQSRTRGRHLRQWGQIQKRLQHYDNSATASAASTHQADHHTTYDPHHDHQVTQQSTGCADAASDAVSTCHIRRSGGDVNDGICDNPLADATVHSYISAISNNNGVVEACQDICDCGSAANGWVATGTGRGGNTPFVPEVVSHAHPTYGHSPNGYSTYGVTDPNGLFPGQSDSKRDCLHDGLKWCKFTQSGSSTGRGTYDYTVLPGFCSSDCSNCKIGDITCSRTTDCEMTGALPYVASTQVNPNCLPKWNNVYDSQSDCEVAETTCFQTHSCMMTNEQLATIGTPVDASKCKAVYATNQNISIVGYTILPGQGEAGGDDRPVDPNCDLATGQDLSAIGSVTPNINVCVPPAGAASCQVQGNCGNGVSCSGGTECASSFCSSNLCAAVQQGYCQFDNTDTVLQALNDNHGIGIDDMTISEIKAQFITGTLEADVAVSTSAQDTMIVEEKQCSCSGLVAQAKTQGSDQTIIIQMENRIQELKNLLDDGHLADICTTGEVAFCDALSSAVSGGVAYADCKSEGRAFVADCTACLTDYDSNACLVATTPRATSLGIGSKLCTDALQYIGVTNKATADATYQGATFLYSHGHTIGTQGCQVYQIDETMEGAAIKQIHEAKEKLRLYLTNTASGAQEIANLESTEASKLSERNAARTAALEYASTAFLDYYKNTTINPRSNAYTAYVTVVQDGNLANDVAGQDDEYIDELHKIFAACQEAVEQKASMGVASAAANAAKTAAGNSQVINDNSGVLNVTHCKVLSTAEYDAKVLLDLKRKAIVDLEAELVTENYVPVADILEHHKHYACCGQGMSNLMDLERCSSNVDCAPYTNGNPSDGHCVAGFCVLNPCVCNTTSSYEAGEKAGAGMLDGFPIADDDCAVSEFTPFCGNGKCDISVHGTSSVASQETFASCPGDCKCGDLVCDHAYQGQFQTGESCFSCQGDCPNTNAGVSDSSCPTDPHKDGQCACYPSSESSLNCESETNAPDDCTCEVLCDGYSTSNDKYAQPSPLSAAKFAYRCPRYGDSGAADCASLNEAGLNSVSDANRATFCSELNSMYDQSDGTVLVNTNFSTLDLQHDVCKAVALNFITECSDVTTLHTNGTSTTVTPDGLVAVAGIVGKVANSGLLANCASVKLITGINTPAEIISLKRWTNPPVACNDTATDVYDRTKIDSVCIDWSMEPGCPAACSCPAAIQPIINTTLEVVQGSQISAEVAENLCNDVCRCPEVGTVGETGHALSYIVSASVYNATSGKVSATAESGCLTVDNNPDTDCTTLVVTDYTTQNDYEAAVGQCVIANIQRVHDFDCVTNGGTQEVQIGCVPVTYVHETIAHNGSSGTNECYGLQGYVAGVADLVSDPADGCRETNTALTNYGSLTGQPCFYGDGTDCKRGDKRAIGGTIVAATVNTTGSGWSNGVLNGGGAGVHTGGNRQCDAGETVSSCAIDCHCGDGVCGTFKNYQNQDTDEDSSICPEDCSFHCYNGLDGGCYEFQRRNYPVGNWDSDKDATFLDTLAGFEAYCSSWPENVAHLAVGGNLYSEIGGAGACPSSTGRRRRLLSVTSLKEWAAKNLKSIQDEVTDKVSTMFRRRKLLSNLKPVDRQSTVPWLQVGATAFNDDYSTCLGSQSATLGNAIDKSVKRSLGSAGFLGSITLASEATIDSVILAGSVSSNAAGYNGIDLLAKQGLIAIQAELDKKKSDEGTCSSDQIAVVHKFSQSWVPTKKCYPLKFITGSIKTGSTTTEELGYGDVNVLCSGVAQLSLSVHNNPSPSDVAAFPDPYQRGRVQDSFLSLTREFSYLGYDKANIVDECTSEAANVCSQEAKDSRTSTSTNFFNSCAQSVDSVYENIADSSSALLAFPGKVACVREFRNNLADIARHIDSGFQASYMPYVGSTAEIDDYTMTHTYSDTHIVGSNSYESEEHSVFAHTHLDNFAPETRDHKVKFTGQRAFVGDTDDESITNGRGTIQACWESYENSVGYATEIEWITASGALSQAIVAVEKESIAIISAHANAKADCKRKCEIETGRDDWNHMVNACQGISGNVGDGPSECKCRRDAEATSVTDLGNPDLVNCRCIVGDNGGGVGDQYENLLGDDSEDCQLQPEDFITSSTSGSQISGTGSSSTHKTGEYAKVYAGESPTTAVQSALNTIISDSETTINVYVDGLVNNLVANLGNGGLLRQQGASSLTAVCHRIHNAELAVEREALDLSNVDSMDSFFANYLEATQTGSLENRTASRRLASEPCELCD